jgi:ubiquitin carboxyl-terminal hydrolase 4/11/15
MFKRILGEYAQQFQGYGQHDSQECINSILDLLSEDLYRKLKKPYVEMTEANGKSDALASEEAWIKHLIRNESVIVDLFHGQYKSTLVCSICSKVSITFDPFMTLSLPIPGKKEKASFFYVPYNIGKDYTNFKGEVFLRESDNIKEFRSQVARKYERSEGSFLVTVVQDNMIKKMVDQNTRVEEILNQGVILLYEINPELNP